MQNSQPYPGFARMKSRQGARKSPRASRRGAMMPAALLAVLLITVLLSQFARAQLRQASAARTEARAVQIAAMAADFDYYVHENRVALANGLTQANTAGQELADRELTRFEADYLRAGVARQMPGFTLKYLVGRIADGSEVFGGLLLSTSATKDASTPEMEALLARLASYGAQDRIFDRASFVRNVLGRALALSERVILTAPLSGLNTDYVLRTRRAGHAAPKLVGASVLDLNGHKLLNVGTLTAIGGSESAAGRVVGILRTPELAGTLTSVGKISEGGSAGGGNVDIADTTGVAGKFTVQRSLTAGRLSILSDSSAGEGDSAPDRIGGPMMLSGDPDVLQIAALQTDTLTAAALSTDNLTSTAVAVTGAASARERLTTGSLRTRNLTAPQLTARQVFTERTEITRLQTEGCTGC